MKSGRPSQAPYAPAKALGMAAVAALAVLVDSSSAAAQVHGVTQVQTDPRRANSGANVTAEVNPGDNAKRDDDSERLDDSYQPKGVEIGNFLFLPKVEVDESFNTNVFATENNEVSDFLTVVRPEAKLRSRLSEHEINFGAVVEGYFFNTYTGDNRTEVQFDVDGRYDFSSQTQAIFFSQLYSRHEDRGSPDDVGGTEPTLTEGAVNRLSLKHQMGRYNAQAEFGADRRTFGEVPTSAGKIISNSDRDRWEYLARQRGSYEMFPGYAAVVELTENVRSYDNSSDRNGLNRNSQGIRAEGGLGVDVSQLVRGDFLIGYLVQDYEDNRLKDPSGLALRAAFNWTPSKLTVIVPALERTVYETTTAQSSSMVRSIANVTIRHELQRNIILTGYGALHYDEMTGVTGQDSLSYEGRGKVIYAFNPNLYVGGELAYRSKSSEADNGSYHQTVSMIRLGLQY